MFRRVLHSELLKTAGLYGFFSFLGRAIPFFLLPILTYYLSPADYGYVANFSVMIAILSPFMGSSLTGAYSRIYFSQERFDHATYLGNLIWLIVLFSFGATILVFLFREALANFFIFPLEWIILAPLAALAGIIIQLSLTCWQVREIPTGFGIFQNSVTLFEALSSIVLVVIIGMNWLGRVLAKSIVSCLFMFVGLFLLCKKKWVNLKFDKACSKHALCFGLPLIPHTLSGILNTTIDRLFISHMFGAADTGLYSVGYQVGSIIGIIASSFNQAYVPWVLKKLSLNSDVEKRKIVKVVYVFFVIIFLLALTLSFLSYFLFEHVFAKEFNNSISYVLWIALGYCFDGMYMMVGIFVFYAEKTSFFALITFLGACLNIVLNCTLMSLNGPIGAGQATTLTFFFTFIAVWLYSQKVFPMPWKIWKY